MPTSKDPCSELAKTITQLAMNVGSRPEVKTLDDVTSELQKLLPELNLTRAEIVNSIVDATTGHSQAVSETQAKLNELKREARSEHGLRRKIVALQKHLREGTLPDKAVRQDHSTETVRQLRVIRDDIRRQLTKSEPAVKRRLQDQIDRLAQRIEDGVGLPGPKRPELALTKEIERMVYERDRLRAEINAQIRALRPKGFWGHVAEPINLMRAVMTSMDFSGLLRQGGFITLAHPVRGARAIPAMFQAFASKPRAHAINTEILNRPNAPKYDRFGLYLAPEEGSSLSKKEEAFMSRLAGKIPLVAGSQRAYNTVLNKVRADSFDAMMATLARNGEVTDVEGRAIANFINVATGRGKLGPAEQAATTLNTIFFAPRYVASRFQLIAGQPFYGGNYRTRKAIAAEYARLLTGLGVVMALGAASGAELEWDPRSSDFGKLKYGNTRIDPLMGLSQTARLIARTVTGSKKELDGDVVPIRGEGVPYRGDTVASTIGDFLRTKLAPFPGVVLDIATGENAVNEPVSPLSAAAGLVTPISFGEIYEVMRDQGIPRGTAFGLLSIFGMGLQHYEEREAERRKRPRRPMRQQRETRTP